MGLKELNSFVLCLVKVKVKLEPHEEQIFVDDDDEVSVSYMYLRDIHRPCFITSAEREEKVSRRSGMYQSYHFSPRLGMQSL